MKRFLRGLLFALAGLLATWTVVSQALGIIPVPVVSPLLQVAPLQWALMTVSLLRDLFGVTNVYFALTSFAIMVLLLWRARRAGRARGATKVMAAVAGTGLAVSIVTWALLLATVAGVGAGIPLTAGPPPYLFPGPDRTITFGSPGDVPLHADLYLPQPAGSAGAPVVVSIHGGGFSSGSRAPSPYTRWLADRGYAVMDIDYRLATADFPAWNTEVGDVGCALTWVTAEGRAAGLDPSRLAVMGGSAGGNLSVNSSYMANNHSLEPTCRSKQQVPTTRAAIAVCPAVDLTTAETQSALGYEVGRVYQGGTPAQFPDRYLFTDSLPHVSPNAPPTLITQGGADHLVRADPVREFARRASQRGVVIRYVEFPTLEHCLAGEAALEAQRHLFLDWLNRYLR